MFPVSRFAATGNESRATTIAVGRGRDAYAQRIVHSSSRIVPPRHTNQATSHGSSAHGANSGSIHGCVDVGQERPRRVVGVAALEPDADGGPVGWASAPAASPRPMSPATPARTRRSGWPSPVIRRGSRSRAASRRRARRNTPARRRPGAPQERGGAASIRPCVIVAGVAGRARGHATATPPRGSPRARSGRPPPIDSAAPWPTAPSSSSAGAEDKVRDRLILGRFIALAGGRRRTDRRHQHRLVPGRGGRRALPGGVPRARGAERPPAPRRRPARRRTTSRGARRPGRDGASS